MATALHVPGDFSEPQARIEAKLRYQACNDDSCLPPMTASAEMVVPVAMAGGSSETLGRPPGGSETRPYDARPTGSDVDRWVAAHGYVATFFLVALLGLGLNLTP